MLDELRQIAIFAKAVDHGSFKGAADELRLAPSVVSHHVSQLEEKIGVTLLYRSTRRLALTAEGKRLLESARIMQGAIQAALDDLRGLSNEPSGVLRITLTSGLSQSHLMDALAAVGARFPKIELQLEFSDVRRHLLDDGFDLAIQVGPHRANAPNRQTLFEGRRCIVGSRSYLASRPKILSPKDLTACQWVVLAGVRGAKTKLQKAGSQSVMIEPKGQIYADNSLAVYRLVKAGAGIAIVPEFLTFEARAQQTVEVLLPDWKLEALDVFAEWPPNAPKDGVARIFISELRQVLAAQQGEG